MKKSAPCVPLCGVSSGPVARVTRWLLGAWCIFQLGVLAGCSSSCVNRGAEFYEQGRYIDAALVFEYNERYLDEYPVEERVRYALYRAATLSALGDRVAAERWLSYAANAGSELQPRGSAANVRARYSK